MAITALQSRLQLNLTHLLSPRSYLTQRVSQLHSTGGAQRFWTLLYLDNKPHGENEVSRHQRKQQQHRDEVTSDRYYGGPPSKSLVVPGARCVFVRDDIALPTTRGFFGNGAFAEAETSSADKFREEPSWRRLESHQKNFKFACTRDPQGPRWKPCPTDPYDPCPKPCPPPAAPVPKRKSNPTTYPSDPCQRPKPTTCRPKKRDLTLCDRKSCYWPVGPAGWSSRNWSSLAASPTGSIARVGLGKSQLVKECWMIQNSEFHASGVRSEKRRSGSEGSGSGDREIDARGPKKKKNKKTKKKKPKTRKDRTICTNSNEGDGSWQICTKPRNNPARKNNPSPTETSNTAASSNNPGPQPPRLCEPDLGWKNSVCPGFPGEPGTCSTHKPGCGRHDVPLPTSPIDTRKQFVEPPKREERVSVKDKEVEEKKKNKETTQEKPKDPCNSDWCPGNSAGSCSTNKPQCTGGGTSRRSYSTAAVMRPREYKITKLPFIPTRSMKSSGSLHREQKDLDKTNPDNKVDIIKKEMLEIEECIAAARCPRPKKTTKNNSGKSEKERK